MKIAILGYGKQGRSAYEYWRKPNNKITICDSNKTLSLPSDVTSHLGPNYLVGLDQYDLIVRSPIIHPRDVVAANSSEILSRVTTNTNEFLRICPTQHIIGVTGTKGKGTTCSLIAKMLESANFRVHLGGNIGIAPLDLLKSSIQTDDWVVLELANFQLIDLSGVAPSIAVCLMIDAEHQDWHLSLEEYYQSKAQLFKLQPTKSIAIYYAKNEKSYNIASHSPGYKIPYFSEPGAIVLDGNISIEGHQICQTKELKLLGMHNWQNVCAALTTVWQITQNVEVLKSVLQNFHGLPFRLELRKEIKDIKYYNDSFATAPAATIAALQSIPQNKIMIIGGFDRQLDLKHLAEAIVDHQTKISAILLIGASAKRVSQILKTHDYSNFSISSSKDMKSIVSEATMLARPGDAIVLSPGFPSFDMFKNFEDRGNQFNAAVANL